ELWVVRRHESKWHVDAVPGRPIHGRTEHPGKLEPLYHGHPGTDEYCLGHPGERLCGVRGFPAVALTGTSRIVNSDSADNPNNLLASACPYDAIPYQP